jgi:hypothetical protein
MNEAAVALVGRSCIPKISAGVSRLLLGFHQRHRAEPLNSKTFEDELFSKL